MCYGFIYFRQREAFVARVIRHLFGASFVPKLKYALEPNDGSVYILAPDVEVADRLIGRSFDVDIGQFTCFYSVLSIKVQSEDDDVYQNFPAKSLYP